MNLYVLDFQDIDKTNRPVVGGKGANLGELCKVEGIPVPDGFCITTDAFQKIIREVPSINPLLDRLSLMDAQDRNEICELSAEIRRAIESKVVPLEIQEEIFSHLARLGESRAYAVRSSATAEDLPTASFAGQQDTYLNITGRRSVLQHISRCWASLFTERATAYRMQNGFDHRKVQLAVLVQKMIFPEAAGILFTADPVSANRKIVSIDAGFGLGEALVSGKVNPDRYKVRDGKIFDQKIADKKLAIYASAGGGISEQEIDPDKQNKQVLTHEQILQLEQTGRKIETHFGAPQDIEWCLAGSQFYIVQSRPITTLYPIPSTGDGAYHVFVSVGHQQMMTDPIKPLGLSVFRLTAGRHMFDAGGRLFVDIAPMLATPEGRQGLLNTLGKSDPLIREALITIIERGDFTETVPEKEKDTGQGNDPKTKPIWAYEPLTKNDPAIVAELIRQSQGAIEELKQTIQTKKGTAVFDFIVEDIQRRKKLSAESDSMGVVLAAISASAWINEKIGEWLGEKNVADILTQSAPSNVTSEMGLALLEVADKIRPYPGIIRYLQQLKEDDFLHGLLEFEGGKGASDAIRAYLDRYGMRCAGEIDITRTRWSEKPAVLVPLILSNVKNFGPHASKEKFEQGLQQAAQKKQELLDGLKQLPDGGQKALETEEKISLLRNYIGYREYPKYEIVNRYFIYKQALLKEVEQLVQAHVLSATEDSYYLSFEELREAVRTHQVQDGLISKRKEAYTLYEKLTPPRVMTSDGEIITGAYKRENIPADALAGLPVSSGLIEGRARVILNMEEAELERGDILVTSFTDPSWTTLFVSIKGLVTEVGGLMTHGAVIAREYGIPAVVGVENATKLIKDGQQIRVHGTDGFVELL
ncbi:MAG: phosphoenolpyruvate synthase [Williamsia sp.]|nr:phosphoenolpyruvate synthase [Williamsia sp.]